MPIHELTRAAAFVLLLLAIVSMLMGSPAPLGIGIALVVIGWLNRNRDGRTNSGRLKTLRAFEASDGWQRDSFTLDGLEADGEALQDVTDEAKAEGYLREATGRRHEWRFVREASSGAASRSSTPAS